MEKIHNNLLDGLTDKITLYSNKKIEPEEIIAFLIQRFIQHTTVEDRKMAGYINNLQ